jgi:hypothetical protein
MVGVEAPTSGVLTGGVETGAGDGVGMIGAFMGVFLGAGFLATIFGGAGFFLGLGLAVATGLDLDFGATFILAFAFAAVFFFLGASFLVFVGFALDLPLIALDVFFFLAMDANLMRVGNEVSRFTKRHRSAVVSSCARDRADAVSPCRARGARKIWCSVWARRLGERLIWQRGCTLPT